MAKILFVDDANRNLVVRTSCEILRMEGHNAQGATWDRGVFGNIPGTIKMHQPGHYVRIIRPEVLFIHIGTNLSVEKAQALVAELLESLPEMRIVILTNLDPYATFGASYSLQLPFDPDDLVALANV